MTAVPKEKSKSVSNVEKQGGTYTRSMLESRNDNDTLDKDIDTVDIIESIIWHRMEGRDSPARILRMGNVDVAEAAHEIMLGCRVTGKAFDKPSIDLFDPATKTVYWKRSKHAETGAKKSKRLKMQSPSTKTHVVFEELPNAHDIPATASTVAEDVVFK
jgi:hypothetical protein